MISAIVIINAAILNLLGATLYTVQLASDISGFPLSWCISFCSGMNREHMSMTLLMLTSTVVTVIMFEVTKYLVVGLIGNIFAQLALTIY